MPLARLKRQRAARMRRANPNLWRAGVAFRLALLDLDLELTLGRVLELARRPLKLGPRAHGSALEQRRREARGSARQPETMLHHPA